MYNSQIQRLQLSSCSLGSQGAGLLLIGLRKNTSLTLLAIEEDFLGDAATRALVQVVRQKGYRSISLGNVGMGDEARFVLVEAMASDLSPMEVKVPSCEFQGVPLRFFVASLGFSTRLLILDLSQNKLTCDDGLLLAEALALSPVLESLNLAQNKLEDRGLSAILESLEKNPHLTQLDVTRNRILLHGSLNLAKLLEANSGLTHLSLPHTSATDHTSAMLRQALAKNRTLLSLHIDGVWLVWAGGHWLLHALKSNSTLQSMKARPIFGNRLDHVKALRDVLERNHSLTHLEVTCKRHPVPEEMLPLLAEIQELTRRNRERPLVLSVTSKFSMLSKLVEVRFHKMSGEAVQDENGEEVVLTTKASCPVPVLKDFAKERLEPAERRLDIVLPDGRLLRHLASDSSITFYVPYVPQPIPRPLWKLAAGPQLSTSSSDTSGSSVRGCACRPGPRLEAKRLPNLLAAPTQASTKPSDVQGIGSSMWNPHGRPSAEKPSTQPTESLMNANCAPEELTTAPTGVGSSKRCAAVSPGPRQMRGGGGPRCAASGARLRPQPESTAMHGGGSACGARPPPESLAEVKARIAEIITRSPQPEPLAVNVKSGVAWCIACSPRPKPSTARHPPEQPVMEVASSDGPTPSS